MTTWSIPVKLFIIVERLPIFAPLSSDVGATGFRFLKHLVMALCTVRAPVQHAHCVGTVLGKKGPLSNIATEYGMHVGSEEGRAACSISDYDR